MRSLILIVGAQGAGKTFLLEEVLSRYHWTSPIRKLISWTTREPRDDEKDGIYYRFVEPDVFRSARDEGKLVEWTKNNRCFYGTPALDLEGEDNLVKIVTFDGIDHFKKWNKVVRNEEFNIYTIFIDSEYSCIRKRLFKRGWEDDRICSVISESDNLFSKKNDFDAHILNEDGKIHESVYALKLWMEFFIAKSETERNEKKMVIRDGSVKVRNNDEIRHIVVESATKENQVYYVSVRVSDGSLVGCSCPAASHDPTKKCKHQRAVIDQRLLQMT